MVFCFLNLSTLSSWFLAAGLGGQAWKNMCTNISPIMSDTFSLVTRTEDLRIDESRNKSLIQEASGPTIQNQRIEAEVYCQLAWELTKPVNRRNRIKRALRASSTDNYPEESIEKTLQPSPKWPNPNTPSYWSSKGNIDPQGPETLTYELETPVSLVK